MKTIESVSNSIISRAKLLGIVVNVSKSYFDEMSKYILGMNPKEHTRLGEYFVFAAPIVEKLREGVTDVTLNTLSAVYENFAAMDMYTIDFIALCNNTNYAKASLYELSSGRYENMRADINRAIISYQKYLAAGVDDDEIFEYALNIKQSNSDEYYSYLRKKSNQNKLTLEIIRRLLPISAGDQHIFITELINDQKKIITNSTRVNVGNWDVNSVPALHGHEGVIYRYGLTPSTVAMLPHDLFKTLDWNWDDNLQWNENFANAAKYGANIVLLWRLHGTPIEFNFRGVLDKSFAEKFPVKPFSGLNKNFLARYNTTNVFERSGASGVNSLDSENTATPKSIYLYSAVIDTKFPVAIQASRVSWNVIECIDGVHYRALGCTLIHDNDVILRTLSVSTVGTYTTLIPGANILGLIMGCSTLPTEYNIIHMQNIEKLRGGMFDPMAPSHISRYTSYDKVVPASEPIKNEVLARFETFAKSRVDRIKNNREWQNLFTGDEFTAAAREILSVILMKKSSVDKIKSPEFTITQIARINTIVSKFLKSVDRASESIPERTFSEYVREDLSSMLLARFIAVIRKAADLMDSDKIWTGHELTLKEFIIAY